MENSEHYAIVDISINDKHINIINADSDNENNKNGNKKNSALTTVIKLRKLVYFFVFIIILFTGTLT